MAEELRVTIQVLTEPVFEYLGIVKGSLFAKTEAAVFAGAKLIEAQWKSYAGGAAMPDGRTARANPGLVASITSEKKNTFHWSVFSDHPDASKAEHGTPAIDMKDLAGPWMMSRKTRVSGGDGLPYLIIPFQHGTPGAIHNPMPASIYEDIRSKIKADLFKKSTVKFSAAQNRGVKESENIHGEMVPRASYNWGSAMVKVIESFPSVANNSRYEGMYAFDTSSGRQSRSGYVTFRILSPKADPEKWWIKAKPAYNMARQAKEAVEEELSKIIDEAIMADLEG